MTIPPVVSFVIESPDAARATRRRRSMLVAAVVLVLVNVPTPASLYVRHFAQDAATTITYAPGSHLARDITVAADMV